MTIGLIVEGTSDDRALRLLIRSCCPMVTHIEVRKAFGNGDLFNARKVRALVLALSRDHPNVERVVVCVDEDCSADRRARAASAQKELAPLHVHVRYCFVTHALESWFLSDPAAVSKWVGKRVSIPPPETICNPAEWLRTTLRKHAPRRRYNKITDGESLAREVNCATVSGASPSFALFLELVHTS